MVFTVKFLATLLALALLVAAQCAAVCVLEKSPAHSKVPPCHQKKSTDKCPSGCNHAQAKPAVDNASPDVALDPAFNGIAPLTQSTAADAPVAVLDAACSPPPLSTVLRI